MMQRSDQETKHPEVHIYDDAPAVARAAADRFVAAARDAMAQRRRFNVALSGGSTPRALYSLLAAQPYHAQVDWSRVWVFWGDERTVPPTDPESNYHMARETLLYHVPVPATQVFRMRGEHADPEKAAALYEVDLRRAFALAPGELPRFDLILLGMGPDGHTASLFPHTAAVRATDRLVVANRVDKLQTWRITLTAPVINHAAEVEFLVVGEDKAPVLARVLQGPRDPDELPSQLVAPTRGALVWLLDRSAAAQLSGAVG
jgi:6-phosphogluconolactonase